MNLKWINYNTNRSSLYVNNKKYLELVQHPNYNGLYLIRWKNGSVSIDSYTKSIAKHLAVQSAKEFLTGTPAYSP